MRRRSNIRFSRRLRVWFYSVFGLLFLSGGVWLVVYYLTGTGDFDGPYSILLPWLLRIHGAAAMASLVVLGVLIPLHMQRGWEEGRNRGTALVMITLCLSMIVSGYGLYYCGDEKLRSWLSGFHSIAGGSLPLVLLWHIVSGRKEPAKK